MAIRPEFQFCIDLWNLSTNDALRIEDWVRNNIQAQDYYVMWDSRQYKPIHKDTRNIACQWYPSSILFKNEEDLLLFLLRWN